MTPKYLFGHMADCVVEDNMADQQDGRAKTARDVVRGCLTASLASLEPETGDPAISLVAVATDLTAAPIILISDLARHTHNLKSDARTALLFDATGGYDAPLEGARVSLKGQLQPTEDEAHAARFLARHDDARGYASFDDFAFWRLEVETAYMVAGFGRIHEISAETYLLDQARHHALIDAHDDIIAHMNDDHADAITALAHAHGGSDQPGWVMTGIDPEGADLRSLGRSLRISFNGVIRTADEARAALIQVTKQARAAVAGQG